MRAVVQRVSSASVSSGGETAGAVGAGFCVLLGVASGDTEADARWMADKIVNLRVFGDDEGKLNRSLLETGGQMLVVSQFTLYGDCRRGRRPSFAGAARPEEADPLYRKFVACVRQFGVTAQTGVFRTHMAVSLVNDGPVTLIIDSPERKK